MIRFFMVAHYFTAVGHKEAHNETKAFCAFVLKRLCLFVAKISGCGKRGLSRQR